MSSICQLSWVVVQGHEPVFAVPVDPQAQLEQVVRASSSPPHAPAFEAPADEDLHVFLHRPGPVGEQRARRRTDPGAQAIHRRDRVLMRRDVAQQFPSRLFAPSVGSDQLTQRTQQRDHAALRDPFLEPFPEARRVPAQHGQPVQQCQRSS